MPRLDAGGVERATADLALAVRRAGARSLVVSAGGALEVELAEAGVELARLPVHTKNPLRWPATALRLARLIRIEKVSLVHVRSRAPAFAALAATRATRTPLAATYHGAYPARTPLKRWYNAVMTRGEAVIANSAFTRAHVMGAHGLAEDQVDLVPEGIDTDLFDPAAVAPGRVAALRARWGLGEGDRPVLLVAGRFTALKGHRIVLEALARLVDWPRAVLVLAGEEAAGPHGRALTALAAAAGLADRVRLPGPCADMPAAFAMADLALAPSLAAESFGRSVAEAGAMGRPVIASALGGPAEIVAEGVTGWLVAPGDIAGWAAALRTALAASVEARTAMGRAARERVTRLHGLEAMCAGTFAVYARLMEGRKG